MNTDTGEIYRGLTGEQIEALRAEGKNIVEVSGRVADAVEIGLEALNRAERRAQQYAKNQRRAHTSHSGRV